MKKHAFRRLLEIRKMGLKENNAGVKIMVNGRDVYNFGPMELTNALRNSRNNDDFEIELVRPLSMVFDDNRSAVNFLVFYYDPKEELWNIGSASVEQDGYAIINDDNFGTFEPDEEREGTEAFFNYKNRK